VALKPRECRGEVTAVRAITPAIVEVDLKVIEPADFTFAAGQWISVPFGPKNVRAWSMVSTPARKGGFTLSIDVAPGGIGSQWVRGLEPGHPVQFKGPSGGFVFNRADPRRAVFVAEEIGIVPVRSILSHLYETGYGRPTALIYWALTWSGSSTTPTSARWRAATRPSRTCPRCGSRRPAGAEREGRPRRRSTASCSG
jgi:ferredoxin-NADP reductase